MIHLDEKPITKLKKIQKSQQANNITKSKRIDKMQGLRGLEIMFDRGVIIYIIRSLYIIIFESKHKKETKTQLQEHIKQFEMDSEIPALLSALSIEELLIELEDAQYRYPIHCHDIELPTFD